MMAAAADAARPAGVEAGGGQFHPAVLDIEAIGRRVERSLVRRVHRLIDDYPDRAAEIVRAWLAERG